MSHFKKYWTSVDEGEITSVLKKKVHKSGYFYCYLLTIIQFEEHYKQIHATVAPGSVPSLSGNRKKHSRLEGLLRANLHTDSEEEDDLDPLASDTSDPWMAEFNRYLKTVEAIPEDMDTVSWWGVSPIHDWLYLWSFY